MKNLDYTNIETAFGKELTFKEFCMYLIYNPIKEIELRSAFDEKLLKVYKDADEFAYINHSTGDIHVIHPNMTSTVYTVD